MAIKRLYDTLVGATVMANQLVDADTSSVTIQSGHKYYAVIGGTRTIANSTGTAISVTGGTDMLTDITAMLGSTIADYLYNLETATVGAGVAKLREWGFFTGEYIPYNAGSLESVEARSHVMTGKNIWGGLKAAQDIVSTVPNATINESGKTVNYSAGYINGKKLYKFPDPNTQYTIIMQGYNTSSGETTTNLAVRYQDGSVIVLSSFVNGISITVTDASKKVESLVGIWATASTVLYYEKCGVFRGVIDEFQFEPYVSHTYDLGTDTLRGLFKLDSNNQLYADGDTKTSDGTVTRKYGVVDLGTLDWINAGANKMFYANALNADIGGARAIRRAASQAEVFSWGIDSKALTKQSYNSIGTSTPNSICISTAGSILATLDTDTGYKNAAAFKTAMSGVMLVYELATPTTEQSTPFTNPQICDPDGTEEYMTNNGVPVGHETRYQL